MANGKRSPLPQAPANGVARYFTAIDDVLRSIFRKENDFTVVIDASKLYRSIVARQNEIDGGAKASRETAESEWLRYCRDGHDAVDLKDGTKPQRSFPLMRTFGKASARLQICSAYKASAWSITVRWEKSDVEGVNTRVRPFKPTGFKSQSWKASAALSFNKGAQPAGRDPAPWKAFLFSLQDVVRTIQTCVFSKADDHRNQGLILITGATASGKSQVARGLIFDYLTMRETERLRDKKDRRLHLLAHEDPVELYLNTSRTAFDYTPREQPVDTTT